jgi:3-oxoacyl-[acyl-carrier-protein] synthase-3
MRSLEGKDIDTVIVATTTPDKKFPAVAVNVQQALGIPPGPAFDVQAVCTGFVYALGIANSFIQTGSFETGSGDRRGENVLHRRLE